MLLFDMKTDDSAVIERIPSGEGLETYSLSPGVRIVLLFIAPFRSSFLVETRERRIMLSRRLAKEIGVMVV